MASLTVTVGLAIAMLAAAIAINAPSAEPEAPSGKAAPAAVIAAQPARQADEQAIRAVAAAVVNTYNAHNAAALAALFTKEAEIVGEDGPPSMAARRSSGRSPGYSRNTPSRGWRFPFSPFAS